MRASIVISTYNRPGDLDACLASLLVQTAPPQEVVVVDNHPGCAARAVVEARTTAFARLGIAVRYLPSGANSLTAARNLGVRASSGNIVLFLDDDVVLDRAYVQEVLAVYEARPEALGVQGYIAEPNRGARDLLHRLFFWYHLEPNRCRVLPSVSATYPAGLNRVIPCQWLSGANHSYRRAVFVDFQYDERLVKYSDGEDLEFSYRVHRRHPGSLFITPFARLVHKTSRDGRAASRELTYMREVYGAYLFFKLFEPTWTNRLIYVWSRVGRFVLTLARVAAKRPRGGLAELRDLVGAYVLCLRRLRDLKRGDLRFFNETLTATGFGVP